ncbi:MAG TPA: ChbG/HpnK family deacetylase [Chloroflexota bacterium]
MFLIVNADDFGISEGVNEGVVEAHSRGILTSTTIMANMPAFGHAAGLARAHPSLGVGVHLNLTSGVPVLPPERVHSLVGPGGRFRPVGAVLRGLTVRALDPRQITAELSAQIERAMDAGVRPTHLDSHHHVHVHPALHATVLSLAARYGVKSVRTTVEMGLGEAISNARMLAQREPGVPETPRARYVKTLGLSILGTVLRWRARRAGLVVADHFRGLLLGTAFDAEKLRRALEALPPGTTELMTHPGYVDDGLRQRTSYSAGRDSELTALLDPACRALLEKRGFRMGSFRDR